ncbi:metalloregulator ArsR/SmtB family transcription factor [Nocardiopsis potens]|uniref:metalloregulator ArsR/SmtB family transcription factor n=1 Tax=Nocardiopsis potens TaxID=1246458 RepID=UPI000344B670|nr:metalloregulator ArsR/SmtB family transcription factor [Nocardiopsis potens]
MDGLLAALADPARWRLVNLLAERPRPVGVLAELAGARQPQTTKHLQALERAGAVTSQRTGRRRVYALRAGPLRDLAAELDRLAEAAERTGGPGSAFDRHRRSLRTERLAAEQGPGWADGRSFAFHRSLAAGPGEVWRHLTEPDLLARWWAPQDLRVSELAFDAAPGGRIVLEYRDTEDTGGTDPVAGRAEGAVEQASPGEHLAYRLSPLLPDGSPAFTARVDHRLRPAGAGTDLRVEYRITDSTSPSADFIAGIETGFGQSLDALAASIGTDTP